VAALRGLDRAPVLVLRVAAVIYRRFKYARYLRPVIIIITTTTYDFRAEYFPFRTVARDRRMSRNAPPPPIGSSFVIIRRTVYRSTFFDNNNNNFKQPARFRNADLLSTVFRPFTVSICTVYVIKAFRYYSETTLRNRRPRTRIVYGRLFLSLFKRKTVPPSIGVPTDILRVYI